MAPSGVLPKAPITFSPKALRELFSAFLSLHGEEERADSLVALFLQEVEPRSLPLACGPDLVTRF